jgi:hypothetical protein
MLGLHIYPVPINLAPISLGVVWHRRNESDVGQSLFRQQIVEAAQRLDAVENSRI